MIRLEKISAIVVLISLIMKLLLIPGGNTLFTLSLSLIACIYYPLGFAFFNQIRLRQAFEKKTYKDISVKRIVGGVGTGIALAITIVGILFKFQLWYGASTNLRIGLFLALIILVISLVKFIKSKDEYYLRIIKRAVLIGVFGLIIALIPSLTLAKIQFRKHPKYIKAYEMFLSNPESSELRTNLDLEYNRMKMSQENFEKYLQKKEMEN